MEPVLSIDTLLPLGISTKRKPHWEQKIYQITGVKGSEGVVYEVQEMNNKDSKPRVVHRNMLMQVGNNFVLDNIEKDPTSSTSKCSKVKEEDQNVIKRKTVIESEDSDEEMGFYPGELVLENSQIDSDTEVVDDGSVAVSSDVDELVLETPQIDPDTEVVDDGSVGVSSDVDDTGIEEHEQDNMSEEIDSEIEAETASELSELDIEKEEAEMAERVKMSSRRRDPPSRLAYDRNGQVNVNEITPQYRPMTQLNSVYPNQMITPPVPPIPEPISNITNQQYQQYGDIVYVPPVSNVTNNQYKQCSDI